MNTREEGRTKSQHYFFLVKIWVLVIFLSTVFCGLAFVIGQQILRMGANDPQIQIAEDLSVILSDGTDPTALFSSEPSDFSKSIAPFVIIFDTDGKAVAGSTMLNGELPTPSSEIFDYTKSHGADRFTWQTDSGIRTAAVLLSYGGDKPGYVLAGRSLREVEKREQEILMLAGIVWFGSLIVSAVLLLLLFNKKGTHKRPLLLEEKHTVSDETEV
ncbi:MAG: hypothetical protein Q8P11_01870 [bacterium]|nr:hypothetical protein [bacterium]